MENGQTIKLDSVELEVLATNIRNTINSASVELVSNVGQTAESIGSVWKGSSI